PTESVEAARKRSPSSGWSPANAPNPIAPVDSTAARSRSTTSSAFAIETPAASYVRSPASTARAYNHGRERGVRPDGLDGRAAPARADRSHRGRVRRSGPDARASRSARARLARRALRARHRAPRDRGGVTDRDDRRGGAVLVPHGAAPPHRR